MVSVDSDVAVGEPGTVSVTIENTGEDATDAVVDFQSGSSDLTFGQSASTSRFVGEWDEGENRTVDLSVRAVSTADTAEYPVQASVSYEDDDGNASQSAPTTFGVTPAESSPGLSVESVDSDVSVGGTGNVSVTLENTGEDATDAVVNLQTLTGDLLFGRTANATRYVGDWDGGETQTVEVTMRATRSADTDEYPVRASVSYEDDDGNSARLGPATFGVTPDGRQEFSLDDVSSDLQVGDSGTISGTVTNDGPKDATDAVLTVSPNGSRDVLPRQSQYVLGDLGTGESASFELPVVVNATTEPGERQVQYFVQYYDSDGDPLRSNTLTATVDIGASEDDFEVVSTSTDAESGGQGTLGVTMENTGEDITDATVSFQSLSGGVLFGESANASQFVEEWEAGDRRTFEFDVTATGDAGETYPMQTSIRYTDADDDQGQAGPFAFGVTPTEDTDDFAVESADTGVESGDQGTLSVTMANTGENVTDATVSFQSLSGGVLFGESANASQYVEEWNVSEERTFEFDVTATQNTAGGTYPMQTSVSYTDTDDDQGQAGPFSFSVTPGESEDDFSVVSTASNVQVGDEGPISVTLENNGENATEATVSLQSLTGDITFGRTANATQFVGEWPTGAQRTVSFNATASNTTDIQSYPFRASVSYNDPDGDPASGGPFTVGVTPQPEQGFDLSNVESTLRVGSDGNVTAQITNQGPQDIDNAVVELVTESQTINPQETEAAVGSLGAGESANVSFPVEVPDSAESGQRQFSFVVEYDNQNGDSRRSGTLDAQVSVAGERDSFLVERANGSVDIGSSNTVTLNVTNNRDTVVSNLNAKAYVDDPVSLSSSEAYINRLAPGETAQICFDVSVGGSASEGQYPLSVDFQYDTPSEGSQLSQTYEVPIDATESDGGGLLSSIPTLGGGLAVLLVLLGVGWVWSRQ